MAFRIFKRFRDLQDVDFGTPADGDVVTYDAGADELVLEAPAGGGTAADIDFAPSGNIAATNVQSALEELDTEKAAAAAAVMDGDAAGGVLAGTYPSPSFAADMATQAELDAHVTDAADAHDASAISFVPAGSIAATNVQDAIEEAVSEVVAGAPTGADYLVGTTQGGLSAEIVVGATPGGELGGTWAAPTVDATHSGSSHASVQAAAEATAQAALDAHLADAADAHDASAISFTPAGSIAATDVQTAIEEVAAEASGTAADDENLILHMQVYA